MLESVGSCVTTLYIMMSMISAALSGMTVRHRTAMLRTLRQSPPLYAASHHHREMANTTDFGRKLAPAVGVGLRICTSIDEIA